MKYTFEKGEKSSVKITVTLTAKEWAAMQDQAYEKTKGKYQLPGFRKGHVPKSVIEQSYGKGAFYEEAINLAFAQYYYSKKSRPSSLSTDPTWASTNSTTRGLPSPRPYPLNPKLNSAIIKV